MRGHLTTHVVAVLIAAALTTTVFLLAGPVRTRNRPRAPVAPNGMAYCPADPATPHALPCLYRR